MAMEWTRRKAMLGKFMKTLRERVQPRLTPEQAAKQVKSNRTTLHRMESGITQPNYHLVVALLSLYGATDEERRKAERLWDAARKPIARIEHAADLPTKYVAFCREEGLAKRERIIAYIAIPGLLQIGAYASAVAEAAPEFNARRRKGWENRAAAERRARQQLLTRTDPLHLHAVIDEGAVRRQVGGEVVMREQLRHLLDMGARDNVTIQVVATGGGAYGTMSGAATILDFAEDEPSSVYVEYAAGGEILDTESDVVAFTRSFERISRDVALSPAASADLIKSALHELEER
ncbi:helix-turn-helix domain-containing protein [Saccharothrix coeruleofusca]|nr:helix-turn-helix transcriptional regulator [Saccharothrix coeruleofusca]